MLEIEVIAAFVIAYCFYVSAKRKGLNYWRWSSIGLAVYLVTLLVWKNLISGEPMIVHQIYTRSWIIGLATGNPGVIAGAVAVVLVWLKFLYRPPKNQDS